MKGPRLVTTVRGAPIVLVRLIALFAVVGLGPTPASGAEKKPPKQPSACTALTGRDKEILEHLPRENIEDVQQLMESPPPLPLSGGQTAAPEKPILRGVTIIVRPVEGLSVERLQRIVQCGLLRAAAADPTQPTDWPRTPPGTTPYVHSGGDKFIIDLRSRDPEAAETMWRTAQQLKPQKGG